MDADFGIRNMPYEIEEAAMIDGCSQFYIITRLIHPIIKPNLAAASLFIFIGSWERVHYNFRHGKRRAAEEYSNGNLRLHRVLWAGMGAAVRCSNRCNYTHFGRIHLLGQAVGQWSLRQAL
ncbi:MAG: hypothetical protein ACOX0K_09840 [Oscillospiraceae bacterium]